MKTVYFPLFILFLYWCVGTATPLVAQSLPADFNHQRLHLYKKDNCGITFDQNGRGYVWRMTGQVHILDTTGQLLPHPLVDLSEEVGSWLDIGMSGFALHPDFPNTPYIYLLYVVDRHHYLYLNTPNYDPEAEIIKQATMGRITRYTADVNTDFTTVIPTSRKVLLGKTFGTGFPILFDSHGLGSLAFGTDGSLLASCGDAASSLSPDTGGHWSTDWRQALADGIIDEKENIGAFRAQSLRSLAGKIIRIDPETGAGLPSNPFYDPEQPRSTASRIWTLGLRNPYRFIVRPNSGSHYPEAGQPGAIYVGDVGNNNWEELNIITTGGTNCGWPLYEGFSPSPDYADSLRFNLDAPNPLVDDNCDVPFLTYQDLLQEDNASQTITLTNPCDANQVVPTQFAFLHQRPTIAYRNEAPDSLPTVLFPTYRTDGTAATATLAAGMTNVTGSPFQGIASIVGDFYRGTSFPAAYQNAYFHFDYEGWIRVFSLTEEQQITAIDSFFTGGVRMTGLASNPRDGALYYVSFTQGIFKISYGGNVPPQAIIQSNQQYGASPLKVQFDGSQSNDPDTPLTYFWDFGDGETSTAITPEHTFMNPTDRPLTFTVALTVTDSLGATATTNTLISLDNTPPIIAIQQLQMGDRYPTDNSHILPLLASVTDAEHTADELAVEWTTYLHHNTHFHNIQDFTGTRAHLITAPLGCEDVPYWYRIVATATDAAGLTGKDEVSIYPNCEMLLNEFQLRTVAYADRIELAWDIRSPIALQNYRIERSTDGLNFSNIGEIAATSPTTFVDQQPLIATHYYRIRAIGGNGDWYYSNLSEAVFPPQNQIQLYPNPAPMQVQLQIDKTYAEQIAWQLYDYSGKLVTQRIFIVEIETEMVAQIDLHDLPAGIYFYRIQNGIQQQEGKLALLKN